MAHMTQHLYRAPWYCAPWLVCTLLIAACGGGSDSGSGPTLDAIAATPATIPLAVGGTQALTVTGTYSNASTANISSGLSFASDNSAVATVSAAGLVTGVANGTAHITITDTPAALSATPFTVTVSTASSTANTLPVTVDGGPPALGNTGTLDANTLFASVTLCTPGTTACQTIDHVQVDTGSYGLQIISSALNGAASPVPETINGAPLRECVQFADGYTWGSMVVADVRIGGRTIASLPVHLIGDAAAGTAPVDCSSGGGPAENTVAAFGANGVLGVGNFLQDCGAQCVTQAVPQLYYACPTSGCLATMVPLAQQLNNPVGALAADNNGAVIVLPPVTESGQTSVSGTLYFGIGTQANNGLGQAAFLTVDPSQGTLSTIFNGTTLTGSVIDSGSNAYFFDDAALTSMICSDYMNFFCPVTASRAPTSVNLSATLQGLNGVTSPLTFTIGNADSLFNASATLTAYPTLGGPNTSVNGDIAGFDWGLPFFFNRSVYILFETFTVGGTAGPAIGF
jgi:hypothetical protein